MIAPKFDIGDKVWVATTGQEPSPLVCPDCLDKRRWECVLPSGERVIIPCPSCEQGGPRVYLYRARSWEGTIGSVRIDTNDKDRPISYMLHETGVGSGTIHYESRLFATEHEARVCAEAMCVERTKEAAASLVADIVSRRRRTNKGGLVGYLRNEIRDVERRLESLQKHLASLQAPVEDK